MAHQIQLWRDSTSNPDDPRYCVSLCETDGGEVKCLSTYALDDHADAWLFAMAEAQRRDLAAVEIDQHGREIRR
jgi:hypothetical protein